MMIFPNLHSVDIVTCLPPHNLQDRPSFGGRLPSLNQLATCIGASTRPTDPLNRPCLLRMGSQKSLSTTTSVAANAPVARSSSPAYLSISPPNSTHGSVDGGRAPENSSTKRRRRDLRRRRRGSIRPRRRQRASRSSPRSMRSLRTLSLDDTAVPPESKAHRGSTDTGRDYQTAGAPPAAP